MLALPSTIPVVFVHSMLAGLVRSQPAPRQWLIDAGIAPALLDHPSARVTAEQYANLLRVLMERSGDEALGFLSRPLRPGTLALLARTTLDAGTLEVALRRLTRAFGLIQDDLYLEVLRDGSLCGVALSATQPNASHPVFLQELLVRVFWRLLAWLVGGRLPVQQFDFAFPRPFHVSSYAQLFPGSVVFDQPVPSSGSTASDCRVPCAVTKRRCAPSWRTPTPRSSFLVAARDRPVRDCARISCMSNRCGRAWSRVRRHSTWRCRLCNAAWLKNKARFAPSETVCGGTWRSHGSIPATFHSPCWQVPLGSRTAQRSSGLSRDGPVSHRGATAGTPDKSGSQNSLASCPVFVVLLVLPATGRLARGASLSGVSRSKFHRASPAPCGLTRCQSRRSGCAV